MTSLLQIYLLPILLLSTPKQNVVLPFISPTSVNTNINVSDWENNKNWISFNDEDNKGYFLKRSIPQLTKEVIKNGLVLIYTKGYDFTEPIPTEKPIQLPFYFFPSNANTNSACKWLFHKTPGEIELGLKMPEEVESFFIKAQNKVQLRYIIIEEAFLKKYKLSKKVLESMSYQQIVTLLNIAS